MNQAKIAKKEPAKVQLKANETINWCACGRSENQPFCDGSHVETDIVPVQYTAEKDETVFLCQCKQTGNPPFCDGTHNKL